ncbi:PqqD family protein [Sandaracinus amylolyticus]|nr:PqqD family protein [Sandaracinus amylolyticus]
MNEHAKLRLAARAVARRVAGRMVVVTLPGLETRVLNEVGARVVELADGRTLGEIVEVVASELDADREVVRRDVRAFVLDLVRERVLSEDA